MRRVCSPSREFIWQNSSTNTEMCSKWNAEFDPIHSESSSLLRWAALRVLIAIELNLNLDGIESTRRVSRFFFVMEFSYFINRVNDTQNVRLAQPLVYKVEERKEDNYWDKNTRILFFGEDFFHRNDYGWDLGYFWKKWKWENKKKWEWNWAHNNFPSLKSRLRVDSKCLKVYKTKPPTLRTPFTHRNVLILFIRKQ